MYALPAPCRGCVRKSLLTVPALRGKVGSASRRLTAGWNNRKLVRFVFLCASVCKRIEELRSGANLRLPSRLSAPEEGAVPLGAARESVEVYAVMINSD